MNAHYPFTRTFMNNANVSNKRRMFAIKDGKLHIAPAGADYSHGHWFKDLKWISDEDKSAIDKIIRGYTDSKGVYVYVGDDFHCTAQELAVFLKFLPQLAEKLNLNPDLRVYAGLIVKKGAKSYPPDKDLGKLKYVLPIRSGGKS